MRKSYAVFIVAILVVLIALVYQNYQLQDQFTRVEGEFVQLQAQYLLLEEEKEKITQDLQMITGEKLELEIQKKELEETMQLMEEKSTSVAPVQPTPVHAKGSAQGEETPPEKTAYLTFDDGPSEHTLKIMDILAEHQIKATFFITANQQSDDSIQTLKRMVDEGHTIANHSFSHQYKYIYSSLDAFKKDFEQMQNYLVDIIGVRPDLYRFPGGSVNGNSKLVDQMIGYLTQNGITYFDWNVDSEDGLATTSKKESIISNVLEGSQGKQRAVILMHDSPPKSTTVEALPVIIDQLKKQGFRFDVLSKDVPAVQFKKQKF